MSDHDEIHIDGDIVNGTFSTRAPKVRLRPLRFLWRDSTLFLIFIIFLTLFITGCIVFYFWSKIAGGILVVISFLFAFIVWRFIELRRIEFKNGVLCPGIVVCENPPTVLILANMACGGATTPVWAVTAQDCRSVKPFKCEVGNRIPCVSAFQGSGLGGSWDRMVANPLTSGTGDKNELSKALARLNDETEWHILQDAIRRKKFPEYGKTLRL